LGFTSSHSQTAKRIFFFGNNNNNRLEKKEVGYIQELGGTTTFPMQMDRRFF
jgi:hypothetical protein